LEQNFDRYYGSFVMGAKRHYSMAPLQA
jgi:hypothetical protein